MSNPVINIAFISWLTVWTVLTLNGRTGTDLLDTFVEHMEIANAEQRFDFNEKKAEAKE